MQNQLKNIRSLSVEYCNEYSENKKILMNKMSFISNFTYAVQFLLGSVKQ